MDAQDKSIADATLKHAFLFFVCAGIKQQVEALAGVHGSLKTGGIVFIADTNGPLHDGALEKASGVIEERMASSWFLILFRGFHTKNCLYQLDFLPTM